MAHGLRAHLHVRDAWAAPDRQVDALFAGFWLSHVPRGRLDEFLALARRWLRPGGTFAFIDSLRDAQSGAADHPAPGDDASLRRLADGREFRIVKVYYEPAELRAALLRAGFATAEVTTTGRFFLLGHAAATVLIRRHAQVPRAAAPPTATGASGRGGPTREPRLHRLPPMSSLTKRTIATVGSGVMAEAMIAGLLRGKLVKPAQVIASHPRSERREQLASAYGIPVVAANADAIEVPTSSSIKPQMLARVGREIGPHLGRGQLVLSIIAGATTAALTGLLGHDQVVRSMPNTPARLGKGMTVWYATPETTADQRAQASTLLGALGVELEVDDEKMVAMATAVSGTGPTYVFLVMEALIDAAVHLGFPRHVAHDLVIETLEGSTLFAKQSGMHPAELRNMVTSPGGTSAAALHELESGRLRTVLSEAVWAAYRRTVELGEQLEAGVGGHDGGHDRGARDA